MSYHQAAGRIISTAMAATLAVAVSGRHGSSEREAGPLLLKRIADPRTIRLALGLFGPPGRAGHLAATVVTILTTTPQK